MIGNSLKNISTVRLNELKERFQLNTQKDFYSSNILAGGLPCGAITEISGFGKTEFVTNFLAEHADLRVAWIEESFLVFPFAFQQHDVNLQWILFVEAGTDYAWAALQTLKAQIFGVVVLAAEQIELSILRRIQLAAEKAHAVVVWLTKQSQSLWPVSLQVEVRRAVQRHNLSTSCSKWEVDILRRRL